MKQARARRLVVQLGLVSWNTACVILTEDRPKILCVSQVVARRGIMPLQHAEDEVSEYDPAVTRDEHQRARLSARARNCGVPGVIVCTALLERCTYIHIRLRITERYT